MVKMMGGGYGSFSSDAKRDPHTKLGSWLDSDEEEYSYEGGQEHQKRGCVCVVREDDDVFYEQLSPKILRQHQQQFDSTPREGQDDSNEDDDADDRSRRRYEKKLIIRALEGDPAATEELTPRLANKVEAVRHNEEGKKAFRQRGRDAEAEGHYTRCIELDPENALYYSNRCAVYNRTGEYNKAVEDAKRVTLLKPRWVKGWMRLGYAKLRLKKYAEAREFYDHALSIYPDEEMLVAARKDATKKEQEEIEKKEKQKAEPSGKKRPTIPSKPSPSKKSKTSDSKKPAS